MLLLGLLPDDTAVVVVAVAVVVVVFPVAPAGGTKGVPVEEEEGGGDCLDSSTPLDELTAPLLAALRASIASLPWRRVERGWGIKSCERGLR